MKALSKNRTISSHRAAEKCHKPEHLPNPVREQVHVLVWISVGCFLSAPMALPWGTAGLAVGITLGSLGIGMGLCALLGIAVLRKVDRQLAVMKQGKLLAHWTYSIEESQQFAEVEWARARSGQWIPAYTLAIWGAIVGLILARGGATLLGSGVFLAVASASAGGLLGFGFGLLALLVAGARYRRRRWGLGDAYIGFDGVYFDGTYEPWSCFYQVLTAARLVDGTAFVLEFDFLSASGHYRTEKTLRIPVPSDREEEAEQILEAVQVNMHMK